MRSSNPQFATNAPRNQTGLPVGPNRVPARWSPALLALVSGLYLLVTLGWSAAGRNDLDNARAASFSAVIALAISLVVAIVSNQLPTDRLAKFGWLAIALGVAGWSAIEIASFNVLFSENISLWRPGFFPVLQTGGAVALLCGLLFLISGQVNRTELLASSAGLVATSLALVSGLALVTQFTRFDVDSQWELIAPIVGISLLAAMTAIAWSNFRNANDDQKLSASGFLLFSAISTLALILGQQGFSTDSTGLVALSRWIVPIATLGLATFAFGDVSVRRFDTPREQSWTTWSISNGTWIWMLSLGLSCVAVVLLLVGSDTGADMAVVAASTTGLLIARQALTLRIKHDEVDQLRVSAEELQRIANIDQLTSLPNRAALDKRLDEEFERAFRYEQPLSLLFADIDLFKNVNDTLGHATGDLLLQEIAGRLRFTARSIDFVARYGGEEFIVVAPGTWSADALILAERLRSAVEKIDNPAFASLAGTTISIGIAGYPEHAEELPLLLDRADKALYLAKAEGRNRVVLFGQNAGE